MGSTQKLIFHVLLIHVITGLYTSLSAQVLCINCYDQNQRVLPDSTNLMINGGFEDGCPGGGYICPNSMLYDCDIPNWICTDGGSETYAGTISEFDPSLVVEGHRAVYFGNSFCDACSSFEDLSCLQQFECETMGVPDNYPQNNPEFGGTNGVSLGQTVYGLIPGEAYELEFWAGGEDFVGEFWMDGLFALNVGFGKIYFRNRCTPSEDGTGTRYVVTFKPASDSASIEFTNWGHISGFSTELIIDDVRLVKSSASGNPCITATHDPGEIEYVKFAPNPFHADATIVLHKQDLQEAQIQIYNAGGSLVRQVQINEEVTEFDRYDLPDGFYLYQVIVDHQLVQTGKLIIN